VGASGGKRGSWPRGFDLIRPITLILLLLVGLGLGAQSAEASGKPLLPGLVLEAGEGLAVALGDNEVQLLGEARTEAPLGGLAKLVWMRLEGADWTSRGLRFKCTGSLAPFLCTTVKGHGRVDVAGALREDCDLAFLAWIADSKRRWLEEYTEAPARLRLMEGFGPFLGGRLPFSEHLPDFSTAWVGQGDLLRSSPEAFLRWLKAPGNEEVISFGKRCLAGYWVEFRDLFGKEGWWFKTASVSHPGVPAQTIGWVVGGRGPLVAVLRIPKGRGEVEGLRRFRQLLGIKP